MTKRKTQEEFIKDVFNLFGGEYKVLGTYVNAMTKIKMKHIICGHEYESTPNRILSGTRCPNCFRSFKKTTEQFKEEVFNLVGNEYVVIGEYQNTKTKIELIHNKCGNPYYVKPSAFLIGDRCMECSGKKKYTTETFKNKLYELVGDEYTLVDEYINISTKINLLHNECNNIYYVKPNSFFNGNRCPICASKQSKGEELVNKLLIDKNVSFDREYTFNDCRNKKPLKFDFAVFNKDDTIEFLVEYDGIQHFEPTFGEEIFEITKINDSIKDNYCESKNIKLIRIPYYEFENLESIVSDLFSQIN